MGDVSPYAAIFPTQLRSVLRSYYVGKIRRYPLAWQGPRHVFKMEAHFFVRQILTWFDQNARDLLWRHEPTPYRVWVSEIMLQQTQVVTVTPYFERWMRELPSVEALAMADEDKVLSLWAGLGYYRRARYLQTGAKYLVEHYAGQFPTTLAELRKIPGVGAYTAGAIASMALGMDVPAIDGNVERVLGRYFAIRGDLKTGAARKTLEDCAERVAACGQAGRVNQAMMDLGASLCSKTAACTACPVASHCQACLLQLTNVIPQKAPRLVKAQSWRAALVLVDAQKRVLLLKRKPDGLLGGLWSFPMIDLVGELPKKASEAAIMARAPRQNAWNAWLKQHGFGLKTIQCAANGEFVRHIFTHIDMHVTLDIAQVKGAFELSHVCLDDTEFEVCECVSFGNDNAFDSDHPISTLMTKLVRQYQLRCNSVASAL